jgi:hypothetical protein
MVRRQIILGNTGSLWKAGKTAKDVDRRVISNVLYNEEIPTLDLPDKFPSLLDYKIR